MSDERLATSETDPSRPPLAATLGEERGSDERREYKTLLINNQALAHKEGQYKQYIIL